jgi:hypothetical protein
MTSETGAQEHVTGPPPVLDDLPWPRIATIRFDTDPVTRDLRAPARSEVRLRVRSTPATGGGVDGAWWPRSREPATEFPDLVLAMSSWIGPVHHVYYHLPDWQVTADELAVEGWLVRLVGSPTLHENTVVVVGSGERRMCVLVVPPGTSAALARTVLRAAVEQGTEDGVAEILARHGIPTGAGEPEPRG